MAVGKMNRRPYFRNGSYTQDAGGGTSYVETVRWQAWAEINDGGGGTVFAQSQDLTTVDFRVRTRFDGRFNSETQMIYEGQICKQQSQKIESEGYRHFLELRYSKTETYIDLS